MNKNYLFSLPEDLQSHIWKQYFSDNIIKKLQNPCGWCGKIVDNDDFENCLDYPFDKENAFCTHDKIYNCKEHIFYDNENNCSHKFHHDCIKSGMWFLILECKTCNNSLPTKLIIKYVPEYSRTYYY